MSAHEQALQQPYEQFMPEDQQTVLNITEHLQVSHLNGGDPAYIADTLQAWDGLDKNSPQKHSLTAFVAAAEFFGFSDDSELRGNAMEMLVATGKLSDDEVKYGLSTVIERFGKFDARQATAREISDDLDRQLYDYRDTEFDPLVPADNLELAITAVAVGKFKDDPVLSEVWRTRLEHIMTARAAAVFEQPVLPRGLRPVAERAAPKLSPEDQFEQELLSRFPEAAPLVAHTLAELKTFTPDRLSRLTLQMPTEHEDGTLDQSADGMTVYGKLSRETVPGALLDSLYHLTDAKLVRDDRPEGAPKSLVVYKGTYNGYEVFFTEHHGRRDASRGLPERTSVQMMGRESAEEVLNELTVADYATLAQARGIDFADAARYARAFRIDKGNLDAAVAIIKDARRNIAA